MLRRLRCCKENTSNAIDQKFCTIVDTCILNRSVKNKHDRVHGVRIMTKKAKMTLKTGGLDFKKKKKKKKRHMWFVRRKILKACPV